MKLARIKGLLILGTLLLVMVAGCDSNDTGTIAPSPPTGDPPPLSIVPDFVGEVISIDSSGNNDVLGSIMVEGIDTIQSSDKYVVTIKTDTLILGQNDLRMTFTDLEPGQQVSIWFSGPVKESYPAQVDALQVIITGNQGDHQIGLGDEFELKTGERAEISDASLDIIFTRVVGDSRCPANARCIWQGEVSVEIEIVGGDGSELKVLTQQGLYYDYSKAIYEPYEISFKVMPYPETEKQIADDEYRLVMQVNRLNSQVKGVLTGHVTIGPLQPVVRPGDDPEDVPPEVYDARKIMVYDSSGEILIEQVDIGHDGNFSIDLIPGTYMIDINNIGMDRSGDVPKVIEIWEDKTVILYVDIDTGIR